MGTREMSTSIVDIYRVAQGSKPLPNDQKIVYSSLSMRLDLFVELKYESSTIIFVGIRYSMSDLLSDLNKYV